jgi:hypothetical protein
VFWVAVCGGEKALKTTGAPMGLDSTTPARQSRLQRPSFSLSPAALFLLLFLLGVGVLLLMITVKVALANTLLIFVAVTGLGLWFCRRTRIVLGDKKLKILSTFWLLKVILTLFLLYVGWIPQLDPSSISWGYDPQRFYIDAWDLIENGWNPLAGSSYQGIVFYYGAIFYLFGHNPVMPALINAFVTLLGTLFLIRCVYSFVPERTAKDWTIASLLLVPEVLWYDVMTARETLMAVLIIFGVLSIGRYLVGIKDLGLGRTLLVSGTALFAILAVRTSMAIPVIASIGIMVLLLRSKRKMGAFKNVMVLGLAIAGMSAGTLIQNLIDGADIDYLAALESVQSFESNIASSANTSWSDNSIGLLLKPNNALQALLYLPPRMVLYLAAPLPNIAVSVPELMSGSWSAWQSLMTIPTSAMMLLGLPFALAGAAQAWRFRRSQPAPMVLHITFWITFMAVAGGNIIIHERYRVMFTLLLFTCMWLGYTRCTRREVKRWAIPWFSLLAAGGVFYTGYKFIG